MLIITMVNYNSSQEQQSAVRSHELHAILAPKETNCGLIVTVSTFFTQK